YNMNLLATAPSVAYQVKLTDGSLVEVDNPAELPETQKIDEIMEPWLNLTVLAPDNYIGAIMDLVTTRRGEFKRMEYIQSGGAVDSNGGSGLQTAQGNRVMLEYIIPLSEVLVDFIDQLKSKTQGYASMDYELTGYKSGKLVKMDILVNNEPVDALSVIVHRERALDYGRQLTTRLKDLIPRQMFEVPVQAAIGGRILARETIRAIRKDVLAKCYGGDITRKRKLLEKQAEGKKRMRRVGRVEIPQEAFLSILKMNR
ncbi:MAG: elongation factor 4, partial [Chloroflexi bacterium]|nr:elongation factor 4 [Chloroflexota bacterium]